MTVPSDRPDCRPVQDCGKTNQHPGIGCCWRSWHGATREGASPEASRCHSHSWKTGRPHRKPRRLQFKAGMVTTLLIFHEIGLSPSNSGDFIVMQFALEPGFWSGKYVTSLLETTLARSINPHCMSRKLYLARYRKGEGRDKNRNGRLTGRP